MRCLGWVVALAIVPVCVGDDSIAIWSGSGKIGHRRFEFTVTAAEVAKHPTWSRRAGPPPISSQQAEDIARAQLRKYAKGRMAEWHLINTTLFDMGDHKHFIYGVAFRRTYPNKASGIEPDQFNVPVLMDGTVKAPKVFVID